MNGRIFFVPIFFLILYPSVSLKQQYELKFICSYYICSKKLANIGVFKFLSKMSITIKFPFNFCSQPSSVHPGQNPPESEKSLSKTIIAAKLNTQLIALRSPQGRKVKIKFKIFQIMSKSVKKKIQICQLNANYISDDAFLRSFLQFFPL